MMIVFNLRLSTVVLIQMRIFIEQTHGPHTAFHLSYLAHGGNGVGDGRVGRHDRGQCNFSRLAWQLDGRVAGWQPGEVLALHNNLDFSCCSLGKLIANLH